MRGDTESEGNALPFGRAAPAPGVRVCDDFFFSFLSSVRTVQRPVPTIVVPKRLMGQARGRINKRFVTLPKTACHLLVHKPLSKRGQIL